MKLVVVDNIACHFRHDFTDMGLRNRILSGVTQTLIKMAIHHDIAVSTLSLLLCCIQTVASLFLSLDCSDEPDDYTV